MKNMKYEKWQLLVIVAIYIALSGCSGDSQGPNQEMKKGLEANIKWMPSNEEFPNGYLDAVLGTKHFKVPKEYVGQHRANGFFDMLVFWPGLRSRFEVAEESSERQDDSIIVYLRHKTESNNTHESTFNQILAEQWTKLDSHSEGFSGLTKYKKGQRWRYLPSTIDLSDGYRESAVIFGCSKQPLGRPNRCLSYIPHFENIELRIQFSEPILAGWEEIHPQIIQLVSSFEIKE